MRKRTHTSMYNIGRFLHQRFQCGRRTIQITNTIHFINITAVKKSLNIAQPILAPPSEPVSSIRMSFTFRVLSALHRAVHDKRYTRLHCRLAVPFLQATGWLMAPEACECRLARNEAFQQKNRLLLAMLSPQQHDVILNSDNGSTRHSVIHAESIHDRAHGATKVGKREYW